MRVGHTQPTRPEWYDRTPVPRLNISGGLTNPPGGTLTLWTYTVPTTRKAWLASAVVETSVSSMPTTHADSLVQIDINDGFGPNPVVRAYLGSSVPGARDARGGSYAWMMPAGYVLRGLWVNASVGGTFELVASAIVTEFDA